MREIVKISVKDYILLRLRLHITDFCERFHITILYTNTISIMRPIRISLRKLYFIFIYANY